jgi:hypothetical protein
MYLLGGATAALYNLGSAAFVVIDFKPHLLFALGINQLLVLPATDGSALCTIDSDG